MSAEARTARIALRPGESLRTRAARGTLVNGAFLVVLQVLGFVRGWAVALFLSAEEYGVWGLLVVSMGTILWLSQVGVDDRYIQQDEADQERAFQVAFTAQCVLLGGFLVVLVLCLPLFALAYGRWDIVPPGLVLCLALPAAALWTPQWVFYRRLELGRQRALQAWDPVVSLVVTCVAAVAGLGYWSLVAGTLAGAWAAALAAVRASPFPLRWRWEPRALRDYRSFSWPLLLAQGSGVLVAQVPILVAQRQLGTAAVGVLALASSLSLYATRVDDIVTNALYPAICAVRERRELVLESFAKSNRLALLWGVPFGVGLALFAAPLVHGVLGERWAPAVPLIRAFGLAAAVNQVAFNASAFFRALGHTAPIAVLAAIMATATLGLAVPLLVFEGLEGFALGILGATAILAVARAVALRRLLPGLRVVPHVARGVAPTLPAAAAVLALHVPAGAELALYVAGVAAVTLVLERDLLRELRDYVWHRPRPAGADGLP